MLACFGFWFVNVMHVLMELNIALFYPINHLAVDFPLLAPIAIVLAKYAVLLFPVVFIAYWLTGKQQHRLMLLSALAAFIMATVLGRLAGLLHYNEQPFHVLEGANQLVAHAIDNSFPSDHTMLFFAVCSSFFLYRAAGRYVWMLLALAVGTSRIVVGVHYPFDVLIGALCGMVGALSFYLLVQRGRVFDGLLAFYERQEKCVLHALKIKS